MNDKFIKDKILIDFIDFIKYGDNNIIFMIILLYYFIMKKYTRTHTRWHFCTFHRSNDFYTNLNFRLLNPLKINFGMKHIFIQFSIFFSIHDTESWAYCNDVD